MNQPTPAIVAQNAVRRLPRIALLLLCAAYLMPGLIGRGPWRSADITAFGYMAELAKSTEGLTRWLDPMLFGLRPDTPALIPYWIGAWAIRMAPAWMNPDLAVRIVFALLLAGTFTATWYAVYYLARTRRAQPVAFAFGGEAKPTDYARAIADGALLALIACLGLAQLGHETTQALTQLFFIASLFYGAAALPYRRAGPLIALAVGSVGLALSGAPTVGLALGIGCGAILLLDRCRLPAEKSTSEPVCATASIVAVFGITLLASALAVALELPRWQIDLPAASDILSGLRDQARLLLWFTWPTWPLAIWTLWRWRRQLTARHVALPLWFAVMALLATWTTSLSDRSLLLGLPAFATLAAFALPTFRRSAAALIDWFTLLFFSGFALIIWVIWISIQTGIPAKPAANVARLAPGFMPQFSLLPFLFALVATLAWAWLVRWRTGRHRAALWKTLVLPAGGTALCWTLVMTLWLPALDFARSYAPQVNAIARRIGQPKCISLYAVERPQIAALRHHGGFDVQPLDGGPSCPWLLTGRGAKVNRKHWQTAGAFRRPTNPDDELQLYRRLK